MLFDVCAYHRVKLPVIPHQGIVLIIEGIKELLFIAVGESFLRSVPYRLQFIPVGGILVVGSFHDISDPVCSELDKGVLGFLRTFATGIVVVLVETAIDDLRVHFHRTHYAVEHFALHVACQFSVYIFPAEFIGRKTLYQLFRYLFGASYPEQFLYPLHH